MFCSKCGNQVAEGSAFCPKCGNKIGAIPGDSQATQANTVYKSKKECIYDALCRYMQLSALIVGVNPTFGELENYEEGRDGMVYCELAATTRNALGRTKITRFGAVVQCVEADGNVVFKGAGPQLMTPVTGTKMLKTVLGFKK